MNIELGECQLKFAELVWDHCPIRSGELVELARTNFNWKKSTTYTVLRVLCQKGLFKTENSIVDCLLTREQFHIEQCKKVVEESFEGSLPAFIAAFVSGKTIMPAEAREIDKVIDEYLKN